MSDGISDGRRDRSLDDILATGAEWITDKELKYIGNLAHQFEGLYRQQRRMNNDLSEALREMIDAIGNDTDVWDAVAIKREALDRARRVLKVAKSIV